MITTFILITVNTFVGFLLALLPTGSLPSGISSSMYYIFGVMNTFNWFFPLDTLFTVLAITVGYELVVMGYYFIMWILRKIPWFNIR